MKEALIKLLKVKTIITILLVISYIVLTFLDKTDTLEFTEIVKMIIIFYFGSQVGKNSNGGNYE